MPETALNRSELAWLSELFLQKTGILLGEDKLYLYETRLLEECQRRRTRLPEFLLRLRQSDQHAIADFVSAMTTQETYFFRDLGAYEMLADEIIPETIARNRAHRQLRLWSAACATGQEPYSLAMLLLSRFPELSGWRVDFLATDISERSLERARAGCYTQGEVNRGLPVTKLLRYFRQDGKDWILQDCVRRLVTFQAHNLLTPPPSFTFDLILCRNVLIYFDLATRRKVLGLLRQRLHPEGVLVLGGSERLFAVTDDFVPVTRGGFVYYRPRRV